MNYNSIAEFNAALAMAKVELPNYLLPRVRYACASMCGDIKLRVGGTGKKSDGGTFSPYSKGHKSKKRREGKAPFGKTTDFKNFYMTGNMLDSLGVRRIALISGGKTISGSINFTGANAFKTNQQLNEIHSAKEFGSDSAGGIIYPNQKEVNDFVAILEQEVFKALTQIL